MYALEEIATGKWLNIAGDDFVTYNEEAMVQIMESITEEGLEAFRDEFNSHTPGRTAIGASPRPH